jgi:hypothetical protein
MDRSLNGDSVKDFTVHKNSAFNGAPWNSYVNVNDTRHFLDALDVHNHRPYLVSVTCLVESPMKMFVYNQNYSSVLFGSQDDESVKNIVRFEANLRWFDFYNLTSVNNKASLGDWRITDFNNVLNENPFFQDS